MLIPMHTTGGFPANALKNENGAAFKTPCASRLTTHAIGRGVTQDTNSLYRSRTGISAKSNNILESSSQKIAQIECAAHHNPPRCRGQCVRGCRFSRHGG